MDNTKAIFLDIDGVLNNCSTDKKTRSKSSCGSYVGIDKDKTKLLAKIVKETDAILVLSSSWKIGWEPKGDYNKESAYNYHAKYLDNHLKKKGGLVLQDKTRERNLNERGMGIKAYLILHPKITNWIVLDDEIFADFQIRGIMPHLVKTDPLTGLTDECAEAAIKMLNNQIQGPYYADPQFFNTEVLNKQAGPANKERK